MSVISALLAGKGISLALDGVIGGVRAFLEQDALGRLLVLPHADYAHAPTSAAILLTAGATAASSKTRSGDEAREQSAGIASQSRYGLRGGGSAARAPRTVEDPKRSAARGIELGRREHHGPHRAPSMTPGARRSTGLVGDPST